MIETQYHVRIDFEYPKTTSTGGYLIDESRDEITDDLLALGRAPDVEDLEVNEGGACWAPYLTCWSRFRISATMIERELETLLRERGCTITEDV